MVCEATDAYDLVIFILFLIFDNDCCCRCSCNNYKIYLCAVRFFINYFVTLGQIVIIITTSVENGTTLQDSLNETTGPLYNAVLVFMSIFGFVGGMFVLLAHNISSSGLKEKCGSFSCCPANRKLVWPFLITSCISMLMLDIFMFVFTTVYGQQEGEKVVEFSSFSDGFRSCMFILSIFDMAHASIGIIIVTVKRQSVTNKVIPEDSTGTYTERTIYKWKKESEELKSENYAR